MAVFLITFRETLEAALIVGILFAFLNKNKANKFKKNVWFGVFSGIILSLIFGFFFKLLNENLGDRASEIFEGFVALIGALLISSLILWINTKENFILNITNQLKKNFNTKNFSLILMLVTLVNILREGVETVIFLAAIPGDNSLDIVFGFTGILFAIFIGYSFYKGILKINISTFFKITNILLILFASGLIAYGIHELQEAYIIPIIIEHIYDINSFINENGPLGSILKGLFGYNGNPSLIETIAYWTYLIPTMYLTLKKNNS
ncbi:FTR1 family iron permease [Thermosipho atlanticus]|uniref:High-affinity iron transporter n=1 Tax=Thermosipho atlanticus DSM 15807 TaxID=1123380 RepID=A0A1M5SDQ2_9BACT|nr:FTR1 family protein [Thermosipho atlanticus]SHH36560.1 high-affinity iron transporter [Thermosipho atlanticus DSM 15807]